MKQLYYTSCVTGKSVGGNSGFQVRAVTRGLPAERLRSVVRYMSYLLPAGTMPNDDTWSTAPVRLALLDTPDAGRILCHSVYVGKDPMTGRWGNFFTHLLLDVPDEFSVVDAIGTWGSDFWHRSDDDGETELPEANKIPSKRLLDDQELTEFMADKDQLELVRFVIAAVLSTKPDQRIVVAASNSAIAGCVYAVTQALPQPLLQDFTFSTYEYEPLTCNAKLIGTTWENPQGMELPSSCYSGPCVGFNAYSGRKTELSCSGQIVEQALTALTSPQKGKLWRSWCRVWKDTDVRDPRLMDISFRFSSPVSADELTKEDAVELLKNPRLAVECIRGTPRSGPPFLERMISSAAADDQSYQSLVPLIVNLAEQESVDVLAAGLTDLAKQRLKGWLRLAQYRSKVSLEPHRLDELSRDISEFVPETARLPVATQLLSQIKDALYEQAQTGDVSKALIAVLERLGPLFRGKENLFRKIARSFPDNADRYWRRDNLVYALACVGCSNDPAVNFGTGLLPEVSRVARLVKKQNSYDRLESRVTRDWDKRSQRRWRKASWSVWDWVRFYLWQYSTPLLYLLCVLVLASVVVIVLHGAGWVRIAPMERVIPYRVLRAPPAEDSKGAEDADKPQDKPRTPEAKQGIEPPLRTPPPKAR